MFNRSTSRLVIMEGGKPENPEKNPRSKARTNNKLDPHETLSTVIEPVSQRWDWGGRLPTAPAMLPALGPLTCLV